MIWKVVRLGTAVVVLMLLACQNGGTRAQPAAETVVATAVDGGVATPTIGGCTVFPADNIWNTPIDTLPVAANSSAYIDAIGRDTSFHPDFGAGVWPPGSDSPIGIPFVVVTGTQPPVAIQFVAYGDESDPGPYPIPQNAPIEGGPSSSGDRHVLVVDSDNCILYELYRAFPQQDGSWQADSGAVFDLNSHALRPDGRTSADAAGLPILPGLIRYEEVAAGAINHAIRFTAPQTQMAYVWPARHYASSQTDSGLPPMGQRFRLKGSFDISSYAPAVQVIMQAMKTYGIVLADNGSAWYLSGAPDDNWDNDVLRRLGDLTGDDFEAVDVALLQVAADSGQAALPTLDQFLYLPTVAR